MLQSQHTETGMKENQAKDQNTSLCCSMKVTENGMSLDKIRQVTPFVKETTLLHKYTLKPL